MKMLVIKYLNILSKSTLLLFCYLEMLTYKEMYFYPDDT